LAPSVVFGAGGDGADFFCRKELIAQHEKALAEKSAKK